MDARFTITAPWWGYALFCAATAALIAAGFWVGRLDRRDGRVFAGIRENDAAFNQVRAMRERSKQRLAESLRTLHAVSAPVTEKQAPRWAPPGGIVIDGDPEPVPDDQREVEPDDGDGYPRGLRATHGAMRLPAEARGDGGLAAWPVNSVRGRHHIEGDHQTRDLAAFVGKAAPPGVRA